jgi:hypothetical protein
MKLKSIFIYGLLVALVGLNSCSESDESPKYTFVAGGITYSLKNTKLYLVREGTSSGRMYRQYFITDGVYTNGSGNQGWSLDDYTDETFYFAVELASAVDDPLVIGEFPLNDSWSLVSAESTSGYIYMESGPETDKVMYFDNGTDHSPVIVSGDMDEDGKLKITFNGTLTHYTSDGVNTGRVDVTAKLYYEGLVIDKRPS